MTSGTFGNFDLWYVWQFLETIRAYVAGEEPREIPKMPQYVLFGAASFGQQVLSRLPREWVVAFCDNHPEKFTHFHVVLTNGGKDAIPVVTPAKAVELFPKAEYVVTIYHDREPIEQLKTLGVQRPLTFHNLCDRHPDKLLPYFWKEASTPSGMARIYEELEPLFADQKSKDELLRQLSCRLGFRNYEYDDPKLMYFDGSIIRQDMKHCFVDGGAYDGDTLKKFVDFSFAHSPRLIAVEPDKATYQKLIGNYPEITSHCCALADYDGESGFVSGSEECSQLSTGAGNGSVKCFKLDSLLKHESPTFIKLDIEGAELSALRGAKETILRCHPSWAVCLYHNPSDLWEVPKFLSQFGYKLYLRRYAPDCWESVCYAV